MQSEMIPLYTLTRYHCTFQIEFNSVLLCCVRVASTGTKCSSLNVDVDGTCKRAFKSHSYRKKLEPKVKISFSLIMFAFACAIIRFERASCVIPLNRVHSLYSPTCHLSHQINVRHSIRFRKTFKCTRRVT